MTDLEHVSLMLGGMRLRMSQLLLQMLHLTDSFLPLVLQLCLGLLQSDATPLRRR